MLKGGNMRTTYTYLYTHFIWSTWKRQNLIYPEIEPIVYRLITEKVIEKNCQLIKIGGTENHIHVLININPVINVSNLIKEIKGNSSFTIGNSVCPGTFLNGRVVMGLCQYHLEKFLDSPNTSLIKNSITKKILP